MSARKVLLVDADVKLLRLVESTLRLKNIEAIATESGEQALHALRVVVPDLVIADIALPDLTGDDLLRRVRSLVGLGDVPFLFLTSWDPAADWLRAKKLKNTQFLRKPFSIDELLALTLSIVSGLSPRSQMLGKLTGSLPVGGVPDVLRMLVVRRDTGVLTVQPAGSSASASLSVRDGAVVYGEFGLLSGVDALLGLLLYGEGRYAFTAGPTSGQPRIAEATLPLLMEGYRLIDEGCLRRMDPSDPHAARMFSYLVSTHRQPTPLSTSEAVSLPGGRTDVNLESIDEDWDDVGLDTAGFAPAFVTGELEAIEAELEAEFDDDSPPDHDDEVGFGTILVSASDDENVTSVALIDDTYAELDAVAVPGQSSRGDSADVMTFFEAVKASALDEARAYSVQLGTRTGRVITSNIPEVVLRDTVASFSSEAIEFASTDPEGTQFASLDAGDLYVFVVEVDHLRLMTLLFDSKPDPAGVLAILKPHLEDYRAAR